MTNKRCLLLAAALSILPAPLFAQEQEPGDNYQIVTHLSLEDAKKKIFPQADRFSAIDISLDAQQTARVQARVGHVLTRKDFTVYAAKQADKMLGYALVDEEIGKYRPITSMVGINTQGEVAGVAIMVYRESRGGEVSHKRFLQQYVGKTNRDPIRVRQDIIAITGATLSVRAVSTQVRKALAVVNEVFLRKA